MDPRENKLPKWAQDAFDELRKRGALSWPTVERPEPYFSVKDSIAPREFRGVIVWDIVGGSFGEFMVRPSEIADTGYRYDPNGFEKGFGQRLGGDYYATEKDAFLESWWRECEQAAKRIYSAKKKWEQS